MLGGDRYLAGSDPRAIPEPFALSVTQWSADYLRIGWPAMPGRTYELLGSTNVAAPFSDLNQLPGASDAGERFVPVAPDQSLFLQLRARQP